MPEVVEAQIAAVHCDAALVGHEFHAEWSPDGVLEIFLEQQQIGCAEAVVLITAQGKSAVDVLAAEGRLKVERHLGRGVHRLREQESKADRSVEIARSRNRRTLFSKGSAGIRPRQIGRLYSGF